MSDFVAASAQLLHRHKERREKGFKMNETDIYVVLRKETRWKVVRQIFSGKLNDCRTLAGNVKVNDGEEIVIIKRDEFLQLCRDEIRGGKKVFNVLSK